MDLLLFPIPKLYVKLQNAFVNKCPILPENASAFSKWLGFLCLVCTSICKVKYSILSQIAFLFDLV